MPRSAPRRVLVFAVLAALVATVVSPAFALFPRLQTTLSGPAINGIVPQGDAKLDQSKQPNQAGQLTVRVRNVNLPSNSVLYITIDGQPVGAFTISRRGEGALLVTVPFEVGRTSRIDLRTGGGTLVLTGGAPWKI